MRKKQFDEYTTIKSLKTYLYSAPPSRSKFRGVPKEYFLCLFAFIQQGTRAHFLVMNEKIRVIRVISDK